MYVCTYTRALKWAKKQYSMDHGSCTLRMRQYVDGMESRREFLYPSSLSLPPSHSPSHSLYTQGYVGVDCLSTVCTDELWLECSGL